MWTLVTLSLFYDYGSTDFIDHFTRPLDPVAKIHPVMAVRTDVGQRQTVTLRESYMDESGFDL